MAQCMRVKWTRRALREQDAAFEWIIAENPRAAAQAIERLDRATQLLGEHPKIGRPGRIEGTRELVIQHTPYILAYRIGSEQIEILAVIHHARDWPQGL